MHDPRKTAIQLIPTIQAIQVIQAIPTIRTNQLIQI
jgi:hypothetical protein